MSFNVKSKDLLGRIGELKTKNGTLETPALLPVVNPRMLDVQPKELFEEFGYAALMTNAYILKKHFAKEVLEKGIHRFLDFKGIVMTDSGAYQILKYGRVEVDPWEILMFQKDVDTDIGVILDLPTGWGVSRSYAKWTVEETLERAKQAMEYLGKTDVLWTGPVQGGRYTDLVAWSAKEMSKLPFDVYALGSPTKVMEQYLFDVLIEMIMSAKTNLPVEKPLHLFGAGHPLIFSFAVALGCDLFDSASYALYAKDDRYITETGTVRLKGLEYFPCLCPVCRNITPIELKGKEKKEREILLMKHNLYACKVEVERIKQSIMEGRLWELLELRARSHPALLKAFQNLNRYTDVFEKETPSYKPRGMLIFGDTSLNRPEILRHRKKIMENFEKPENGRSLLLLPGVDSKPSHASPQYRKIRRMFKEAEIDLGQIHICFYSAPFGVIPVEIDDIYPLSQFEMPKPSIEMKEDLVKAIVEYVNSKKYGKVFLHPDFELLDKKLVKKLRTSLGLLETTKEKKPWYDQALSDLMEILKKNTAKT